MMEKKKAGRLILIIIVLLLALGLRTWAALNLGIDYDEPIYLETSYDYSRMMADGRWDEIIPYAVNIEHPPLSKLLFGVAMLPLPPVESVFIEFGQPLPGFDIMPQFFTARFTAVALSMILMVVLVIINPAAGFAFAIHSYSVKYGSQIYLEALPMLTSAAAILAYHRSEGKANGPLLLSAAMLGLTAASKIIYCVVGLAILFDWFISIFEKQEDETRGYGGRLIRALGLMLGWGLLSLAFYFAANPHLWSGPVAWLQASLGHNVGIAAGDEEMRSLYGFFKPLDWLFISHPVQWHSGVIIISLDGLIVALGLIGIVPAWKRFRIIPIWWLAALAFIFLWPVKLPQYILIMAVPIALCAGEAVAMLIRFLKGGETEHKSAV